MNGIVDATMGGRSRREGETMAKRGEDSRTIRCPSCGASLQTGIDDQFFCEYCGSPLPGGTPGADWLTEEINTSERLETGAELPDWLAELGEPSAQVVNVQSRGAETHPKSLAPPGGKTSKQGRSRGCVLALAVLIMLGCFCLGGWMALSALGRQDVTPSLPSKKSKVIMVSAQEPWQYTGVRVRNGQVVSISYLGGTWGVWGGARGAEHQIGYLQVEVQISSAE